MDKQDSPLPNQQPSESQSNSVQDGKHSSAADEKPIFGNELTSPAQLKREAAQLIANNEMPSLEEFLDALAETRKEFAPKIREARKHS